VSERKMGKDYAESRERNEALKENTLLMAKVDCC